MDPITLSVILGGVMQGGSAIAGAFADSNKAQNDWLINWYNLRQREKERQEAKQYADQIRGEQKLGATNAAGDRTHFVEGVGWVTDPSSRTQELLDYFYGQELPERRSQFARGAERSRTESDVADQYLEELQNIQRDNPADVEAMLYEAATRGIGDATSDAMETAMRSAIRSGTSNTGRIASGINEAAAKQRGNAAKDAKLQSLDYVDDRFNSRRGAASQLYNLFASRAGQDIGMSLDPSQQEGGANALLSQFSQLAQQGSGIGANAVNKQGGTLNYMDPDYGIANMLSSMGSSIAGVGDRVGAISDRNSTNALLRSYIENGGNFSLNNGGIFNDISGRVRTSGGGVF